MVVFHVDAAQAAGKIPIDMQVVPVDLLSISAHKFYGPKGVGVLFVRRKPTVKLEAMIHGGGQEQGLRSGLWQPIKLVGMVKLVRWLCSVWLRMRNTFDVYVIVLWMA